MISTKKAHLRHRKYTLPKGHSVASFVIRELDGHDELEAARWIQARGSADNSDVIALNESLRISIVAVDGSSVQQPYLDMDKWSASTRRLLVEAWSKLNSLPDSEIADFLDAAEDLTMDQAPAAEIVS